MVGFFVLIYSLLYYYCIFLDTSTSFAIYYSVFSCLLISHCFYYKNILILNVLRILITTRWAQSNHLYCLESWSRSNNTFRIVIPVMVVGPRRAMSPSSIFGLLQNIYSLPCRWKDNSPLVHRRSVTKKEWISPSMSQRIKRGAPTRTQRYIYKQEPRKGKVRTHTEYSNTY